MARHRRGDRAPASARRGSCGSERAQHFARREGTVSIIDFDRGRLRGPGAWTSRNLAAAAALAAKIAALCRRIDSRRHPGSADGRIRGGLSCALLYSLLIRCAVPFAFALVLWRGLRDRRYWQGLSERFGVRPRARATPALWLHAVTLGEMSAAAPLVRALRARYPDLPLVVTTATPAGRARASSLFGDAVRRALSALRHARLGRGGSWLAFIRGSPSSWKPNCGRICCASASGAACRCCWRARGFRRSRCARYRRFGSLFARRVHRQLAGRGANPGGCRAFRVDRRAARQDLVVGNVKFDLEIGAGVDGGGRALRASFGSRGPVWIAGSTHAGEEEQVLDAHAHAGAAARCAVAVGAEAQGSLRRRRRIAGATRREVRAPQRAVRAPGRRAFGCCWSTRVGELAALYASADAAFVGGSLVPIGGHNLLEPAALGLPVLTGPFTVNGREIAQLLLSAGRRPAGGGCARARGGAAPAAGRPCRAPAHGRHRAGNRRGESRQRRALLGLIEPWLPAAHPAARAAARPSAAH